MTTESSPVSSLDFARISRAIDFMARHATEQPSLARTAAAAGVSEYHFARMFRRWAGISPKQLLQRLSLEAAKHSLRSEAPVLEAALDAGLSGAGRLHDLFVTLEAVTPGEFKSHGAGVTFRYGSATTPFGDALIATSPRGIAFVGFSDRARDPDGWDDFRRTWRAATWVEDRAVARKVSDAIWGVVPARGRRLTLWVHGTNFQVQVWQALLRLARDTTVTYSDIAREIGQPASARAVGGAVGANPVAWLIPCHHVLRASGALGGYRWGVERKQAMLAWELSQAVSRAT